MKANRLILVLVAVFTLTVILSSADGQLLKKVIKTKGGGGSNIVKLISLIPDDAELLLSVNWENLSKTELIDIAKEQLGEDFEILEAMGIDIRNDVKHVIFGMTFEESPIAYGVVAGSFDEDKIMKMFKEQGVEIEKPSWGRDKVYAIEDLYFTFKKSGLLFAASDDQDTEAAFKKMLNVGKNNLANNKQMVDLVQDTDTTTTAWGVLIIPDELKDEMASEGGEDMPIDPRALTMVNLSVNYGTEVQAAGKIYFSKSGEAKKLNEFLGEQIRDLGDDDEVPKEVKDLLNNMEYKVDGSALKMNASMDSDQLKQIIQQLSGEAGDDDDADDDDDDGWDDDDDDDDGWDDDDDDDDWDDDDDDDDGWDDDDDDGDDDDGWDDDDDDDEDAKK